jgi:hypothetical protein
LSHKITIAVEPKSQIPSSKSQANLKRQNAKIRAWLRTIFHLGIGI